MKTFNMTVTDKRLVRAETDKTIVCGNGGYLVKFKFDTEWNTFSQKTARFTWNGEHRDVEFTGDTCVIPMIVNASVVTVGVYAGEDGVDEAPLATTNVSILCIEGSRCGNSSANGNSGANYTNEARGYAVQAQEAVEIAQAVAKTAQDAVEIAQEAAETAQDAMSNLAQYKGLEVIGSFTIAGSTTLHATYGFLISEDIFKYHIKERRKHF